MSIHQEESLLASSLASLKAMIQRALEVQEEESVPTHTAAVIDRVTGYEAEEKARSLR